VKRALAAAAAALSYFTILPVPAQSAPDAYALSFLPLVGALVGALAGAAGYGAWLLTHSILWCALVAWIVSIAVSGAIHLDGFLDCCDGVLASTSVQRRLEILRDPAHGTYALVGMAMLSAVWIAGLSMLPPMRLPLALAFIESLARLAAVLNAWWQPYARPAVTPAFSARPSVPVVLIGAAVTLGFGWALQPNALVAVAVAIALAALMSVWIARRLGGGLTGDCYGALVCLNIVITLPLVAAMLRSPAP
jgi:adenosylcobinamide-GDP ribazoletransferase